MDFWLLIPGIIGTIIGIQWFMMDKESGFVTMGAKGKITKKLAQIVHTVFSLTIIISGGSSILWAIVKFLKTL
jgi:hypothetical protein